MGVQALLLFNSLEGMKLYFTGARKKRHKIKSKGDRGSAVLSKYELRICGMLFVRPC